MKKISILLAVLAVMTSFSSCKRDNHPRLEKPTEFVLNVPPMANQLYEFREDEDGNCINTLELTVSQPNYGLGTVPDYQVEVSNTADFEVYETLETIYTGARMNVSGEELCLAICKLYDYTPENGRFTTEPVPVFVRVHAWVPNADYSSIYSNVIELKQVSPYLAVKVPGVLYLVGDVSGWAEPSPANAEHYENWQLVETEIDSKIYKGVFTLTSDQASGGFRFYNALEDWGKDNQPPSIGAAGVDSNNDVAVNDQNIYSGSCVWGKGNWNITNWPGGPMEMTVNLKQMTVEFKPAE